MSIFDSDYCETCGSKCPKGKSICRICKNRKNKDLQKKQERQSRGLRELQPGERPWSRNWDVCTVCHEADAPHCGQGLCMTCYHESRRVTASIAASRRRGTALEKIAKVEGERDTAREEAAQFRTEVAQLRAELEGLRQRGRETRPAPVRTTAELRARARAGLNIARQADGLPPLGEPSPENRPEGPEGECAAP